jgi:hypothetical protein
MTPETIKTIATALFAHVFTDAQRKTPKLNAQAALEGWSHYCDDSTLRFHHSRIVGACVVAGGAFFKVTETCTKDYENTKRGYRVVLFDMMGEAVYHPSLDDMPRTREQAERAFFAWFDGFDQLAHYRAKLDREARKWAKRVTDIETATANLINA